MNFSLICEVFQNISNESSQVRLGDFKLLLQHTALGWIDSLTL